MLWLAGLIGLMAVSAVAYVDLDGDNDETDPLPEENIDQNPRINLILGSQEADAIDGTDAQDRIAGDDGDDLIDARAGDDEARGGAGNDTVIGGSGNDSIEGEDGDDALYGGELNDAISGHNDDDVIYGNAGDDALNGSAGDDSLFGGTGADSLHGGLGNDLLVGGAGQDVLFGGWGNDTIDGLSEEEMDQAEDTENTVEYLNGGGGDDLIIAGSGDVVTSGAGADAIVLGDWIAGGHVVDILDFEPEEDTLLFVWDDTDPDAEEPLVSIRPDPDLPGTLQVWMGDQVMAQVRAMDTPLTGADISLIPQSAMSAMTLQAA